MNPLRAIVIALWALAACSSEPKTPAPPAPQPAPGTASAPAADRAVAVGDPAPAVTLTLHDGTTTALSSLKGQQALVYFYPKDDTPGCTIEAQGLRDAWSELEAAGVKVFGVSLQDAASHQRFIDKHDLPFPLVVDEGGVVAKAFDVPVRGEYAARHSFLIGTDGTLTAVWREVDPRAHAAEVLAAARRP